MKIHSDSKNQSSKTLGPDSKKVWVYSKLQAQGRGLWKILCHIGTAVELGEQKDLDAAHAFRVRKGSEL